MLHHCVGGTNDCHIHFIQTFDGVASGTFDAPDHEYPSYLELQLTATDPTNGLQTTTSVRLDPQTVTLTLQSTPAGVPLSIDGFTGATPFTYDVIIGSENTISGPSQQAIGGRSYLFTAWSDGGAQSQSVLGGSAPATYTATYTSAPVEASKVTLSDTSPDAPSLWTSGVQPPAGAPAAALAWIGSGSVQHLNVMTSTNGTSFGNKVTLSDSSFTTPSVLVVNSNIVVLAWTGKDSRHSLNVMYDVYGARKKVTLKESSPYAPSLAYFNGQIWLAWTGADGNRSLNVLRLGPTGLTAGAKTILSQYHGGSAPRLVADDAGNQLLLTWTSTVGQHIALAASSDGTHWSTPANPPSQTSISRPDVLAAVPAPANGQTYYWAWTGTNSSHKLNLMFAPSLSFWSAAVTFNESSPKGPVLGYIGSSGNILLVWIGTDHTHRLNIATIAP